MSKLIKLHEFAEIMSGFDGFTDPDILKLKEEVSLIKTRNYRIFAHTFIYKFFRYYFQDITSLGARKNENFKNLLGHVFSDAWAFDKNKIVPGVLSFFQRIREATDRVEGNSEKIITMIPFFDSNVTYFWFKKSYYWFKNDSDSEALNLGRLPFFRNFSKGLNELPGKLENLDPIYLEYFSSALIVDAWDFFHPGYPHDDYHPLTAANIEFVVDFLIEIVTSFSPEIIGEELAIGYGLMDLFRRYPKLESLLPKEESESPELPLLKRFTYYQFNNTFGLVDMAIRHRAVEENLSSLGIGTLLVIYGLEEEI